MTNRKFFLKNIFPFLRPRGTCVCIVFILQLRVIIIYASQCVFIHSWVFYNKNPKGDSSRNYMEFCWWFFFLSKKVGWWVREKKVKYYFPPPLFELSELNRISFFFFCFYFICVFFFSVRASLQFRVAPLLSNKQ